MTLLALIFSVSVSGASDPLQRCLSEERAEMPQQNELKTSQGGLTVKICYLPEKSEKGGIIPPNHEDEILLLRRDGRNQRPHVLATAKTQNSITIGRIDNLILDKEIGNLLSVRYGAGEFCEGIVVFRKKPAAVLYQQGCESELSSCRLMNFKELKSGNCELILTCGTLDELEKKKAKSKRVRVSC